MARGRGQRHRATPRDLRTRGRNGPVVASRVCVMCHGSGCYVYTPASGEPYEYRCAACNGSGVEPD